MAKKKAAAKTASRPSGSSKGTAQKPLSTGDVSPFPEHTFRADLGQGLPPQKDTLNPNRAK